MMTRLALVTLALASGASAFTIRQPMKMAAPEASVKATATQAEKTTEVPLLLRAARGEVSF